MKIQNLAREEVFKSLFTSDRGLSEDDAKQRLHEYGFNEIREVRKKPLWQKLIAQFTHFLAVLLWIAAGLSFLSEYLRPGEGMFSLGIAIVGVIVINAVFTFIQEYRAEKAVEELVKLLPFNVKIIREGVMNEIQAREVVPGDIIILNEGDKIPADARLVDSNRLKVNNAPLTGESDSKPCGHKPFEGDYLESPNIVFAGTLVVSGSGRAVALATGMTTEFGKIAHLTSAVEPGLSPLQKEIKIATRIIAVIAVTTGVFFFALGLLFGRSLWQNFLFCVGIIAAIVPEGLLPTVTLSLAMGSQRMARKKALIKTLTSVETLGSVTVICTDKTGTLTQNRMEVRKIWLTGAGRNIQGREDKGLPVEAEMLMKIACLCNNASYENGKYRGDPTETALLKAAREALGDIKAERIAEIPFDSDRKRMTTINVVGSETLVLTKGALETVLPLCKRALKGKEIVTLNSEDKESLAETYNMLMDEGLRVIAFAFAHKEEALLSAEPYSDSLIESDLVFAGLMGLEDPPRPEIHDAVRKCREAGIKIIMLTGDASRTAIAIAREIELVRNNPVNICDVSHEKKPCGGLVVVEGAEMDTMPDSRLREVLMSEEVIFARMTPKHKMRIVSVLKDEGERVAVTGDGVNDAPALKRADIGIAMGIAGTDVAKEAADMVLLDDNFATIVNAIEEGRAVFENIKKFIVYVCVSNVAELAPFIAYILFRIPLPLTIMQILAIDLGTDMFPALALGAERPSMEVMRQPPRRPEERLLTPGILARIFFFLGVFETIAGFSGFFYVLRSGGWQWGETLSPDNLVYIQATTACFGGIVITQIANVFACRSFRESLFSLGFFSNRLVLLGVAVEMALSALIIYNPFGNKMFGTAPLELKAWLFLIPFAFLLLAAEELRKAYIRRLEVSR